MNPTAQARASRGCTLPDRPERNLAEWRRARRTDEGRIDGEKDRFFREFLLPDYLGNGGLGRIKVKRSGRLVLHPLAEVRIGVLMPIRIGGSQLMMDIQCDGEWRQDQEDETHGQGRERACFAIDSKSCREGPHQRTIL